MLARQRTLKLLSAVVVALLSGGAAWAATGGIENGPADAPEETTTTVSESVPTTESTTTTVAETTTTTESTTTTVAPEPDTDEPADEECKPGWGYGDKNHCHSGPPGQDASQREKKHGGSDDAEDDDEPEEDVEDD
jgi:hypothetical protein